MEELEKMADARKMTAAEFAKHYVRATQGRLSLRERVVNSEHLCCFFDPIDCQCTIYASRPEHCRTFPFWNKFQKDPKELFLECPGVSLKKQG